ncbi:DNA-3-methyladenine glycosylase 2 family protein [Candidatus Puniceispirillum sp.]|nr:DNA-3-methyladenine glycosylase 2 family protein [Candidatus Puniceispirillum sp.]
MSVMQKKILEKGAALDQLAAIDPDIAAALTRFGPPPDRSLPASFETLARSILGQQISRAAASAIWARMHDQNCSKASVIAMKLPDDIIPLGLSRRKAEYMIGIAIEIESGTLNLADLETMTGNDVQKRLIEIRGIGTWTADNFRLFALGDMDAWPAKDLALQEGMRRLKGLKERPSGIELCALGDAWRPFRGAGALMLWHIYGILVRKATIDKI